jgi:hypothetical protein
LYTGHCSHSFQPAKTTKESSTKHQSLSQPSVDHCPSHTDVIIFFVTFQGWHLVRFSFISSSSLLFLLIFSLILRFHPQWQVQTRSRPHPTRVRVRKSRPCLPLIKETTSDTKLAQRLSLGTQDSHVFSGLNTPAEKPGLCGVYLGQIV